jgi:hypothetical protein
LIRLDDAETRREYLTEMISGIGIVRWHSASQFPGDRTITYQKVAP